jgi:hypothetical protein
MIFSRYQSQGKKGNSPRADIWVSVEQEEVGIPPNSTGNVEGSFDNA